MDSHYREIELSPRSYWKDLSPLKIGAVNVFEEMPPAAEAPLQWFLLTTLAVSNNHIAEQCIRCYRLRWPIDDWHRVLKSGYGARMVLR